MSVLPTLACLEEDGLPGWWLVASVAERGAMSTGKGQPPASGISSGRCRASGKIPNSTKNRFIDALW